MERLPAPSATRRSTVRLYLVLAAMTTVGPFSLDMYLPGLPSLAREFHASVSVTQLTFTTFLLGLAAGQMIVGPLSDSVGRKRPVLVGFAVYATASLLCAFAPSIDVLIALRLAQGFAAGCAAVIATAIVRDRYAGREAASFMSMIVLVTMISPMFAPSVGAQIVAIASWRTVFVVLAAVGVGLTVVAAVGLPETHPKERRREGGVADAQRTIGRLSRDGAFLQYALPAVLGTAAFFSILAGSSFIFQDLYGLSPAGFGLVFSGFGLTVIGASQLNRLLLRRISPADILRAGLVGSLSVCTALIVAEVLGQLSLGPFIVLLLGIAACNQFIAPNATALALTEHPEAAGTAAAIIGMLRFGIGALIAPVVGIAGSGTAAPMIVVMLTLSLIANITFFALRQRRSRTPEWSVVS